MLAKLWITLATGILLVGSGNLARAAQDASPSDDGTEATSEAFSSDLSESVASEQIVYQAAPDFPISVRIPNLAPGLQFHAGVLFLQPSADNLGWAVLTTEKNFASPVPLATPYWRIETLTPQLRPGLEVGGGYTFANSGRDVQMNWQNLRTSTTQSAAVTQSDGQWISPFNQTGPPTADSYNQLYSHSGVNKLLSAEGSVKFEYDVVDLDFGQNVSVGSSMGLRFFGGVGFARLRERVVSSFFGATPDPNAVFPNNVPLYISLNNTSTFSGFGPRLGLDTTYRPFGGLRFTGQLAGALLVGQTQPAQYLFTATAPDLAAIGIAVNQENISSEKFTHVVSAATGRLGLGWTRVFANRSQFTVDAGYLAALYVNPFSGYETNNNILALQIGSLSTASMRHTLSNFTAQGLYLNGGLKW